MADILTPEAPAVTPEADAPVETQDKGSSFYQNSVTKQIFRVKGDVVEALTSRKGWQPSGLPIIAVSAFTPVQIDPEILQGLHFGDDDKDAERELSVSGDVVSASTETETELADVTTPEDLSKPMEGAKFRIPLAIPEGIPSGDRRQFAQNSLEFKDCPMPLLWQKVSDEGHKGSVTVGRIDSIERIEGLGLGNAVGVFDTHEDAIEAARQVREKMATSISGDVDQFEAELAIGDDGSESLLVHHGRMVAATIVAKPAFQEATIELIEDEPVILASAGPLHPDRAWFDNPRLASETRLTVTEDGRVFGHIATWDTKHMANPNIVPPKSRSNYKYFNAKPLRLQDGSDINVGQLTLAGGHADLRLGASAAAAHYDDTRSAVADVVAGEDEFGIWVAGAMRPDVTDSQIRAFRASDPSGDWRMTDDGLELIACCQVNVPGFPVARTMVASGVPTALVAAGATMYRHTEDSVASIMGLQGIVASLSERLEILETERANARRAALIAKIRHN